MRSSLLFGILLLSVLQLGGCFYVGSIRKSNFKEVKKVVQEKTKYVMSYVNVPKGESLRLVGHRSGSTGLYPKDIKDVATNHSLPVNQLMDNAFGPLGLNSIEIDVQMLPDDPKKEVYILHNFPSVERVKEYLNEETKKRMQKNALANVLLHFIKQKYYLKNNVYLELKAGSPFDLMKPLDKHSRTLVSRTYEIVHSIVSKQSKDVQKHLHKRIAVLSFSYKALELFAQKAKADKAGYTRHVILVKSESTFAKKLATTDIINGVWFDPWGTFLNDPALFLYRINKKRLKNGLPRLDWFVSLYLSFWFQYRHFFSSKKRLLAPVQGVIYDIRGVSQ